MPNDIDQTPVTLADAEAATQAPPRSGRLRQAFRHRSLALGVLISAVLTVLVLAPSLLHFVDPDNQDPALAFSPPSAEHLMGADSFGRDMLARVLYGGRTTMLASLCVVAIGAIAGTTLGLIAGYFRGTVGFVVMRLVDLLLAFPGILLALAVAAVLGPGLSNGVIAIAVILTPVYARLVEGATSEVRNLPYVDAAVTLGGRAVADHPAPRAAELGLWDHCADHQLARHCGPVDRGPGLHRPRRATPGRGMGRHPERRPELHHGRLVDHLLPRPVPRAVRCRREPDRRRPARRDRPDAQPPMIPSHPSIPQTRRPSMTKPTLRSALKSSLRAALAVAGTALGLQGAIAAGIDRNAHLVIGWGEPVDTLNPAATGARDVGPIDRNIFDTLIWLTPDLKLTPHLAMKWSVSDDNNTNRL